MCNCTCRRCRVFVLVVLQNAREQRSKNIRVLEITGCEMATDGHATLNNLSVMVAYCEVCVRRLRVSHPSPGKHMTRLMKLKKIQIFQVRMRFFKAGTPQGSVPKYKNRCNVKRLGCLASVLSSLVFFFIVTGCRILIQPSKATTIKSTR